MHLFILISDIDECAAAKNACPLKNTYCLNTVGSFKCLCSPGYSPVYNDTQLSSCRGRTVIFIILLPLIHSIKQLLNEAE